MGRPLGRRNANYDLRKAELIRALIPRLLAPDGQEASFRELARSASVSTATLRHYFDDRDGLVEEAMATMRELGAPHIKRAGESEHGPPRESLSWFLASLVKAWTEFGVGRMVGSGLAFGMHHQSLGPAFVNELLEPTLQSCEKRIARHVERGELPEVDVRHAALALVTPVLLGLIHQDSLGGAACRPLDLDAFVADHLERWFLGWGGPAFSGARS